MSACRYLIKLRVLSPSRRRQFYLQWVVIDPSYLTGKATIRVQPQPAITRHRRYAVQVYRERFGIRLKLKTGCRRSQQAYVAVITFDMLMDVAEDHSRHRRLSGEPF
jgi:hypothetical protein